MMDELLEQFLIEGRELIASAQGDLARLGQGAQNADTIDSAFRAVHTLKGSVAIFAMSPAERLLHAAEDVLARARKGSADIDMDVLEMLVECLDQTDRWVDDMERSGALPDDAPARSAALMARIAARDGEAPEPEPALHHSRMDEPPPWLAALLQREAKAIAEARAPLTAFCYTPDTDCFFRGENPLSVAEAVPQLVTLKVLPAGGAWPSPAALEPFSCFSVLVGLSAAPQDTVRAAFRLQPEQVEFHSLGAAPENSVQPGPPAAQRAETLTVRVEAARLDALAAELGDLVTAINALTPLASDAQAIDRALAVRIRSAQSGLERCAAGLHRDLSAARLVPLEPALRRLPRLAREIALGLGKQVALDIRGAAIEVDKQIADALFEPLLHLLRNALDHGIETPERRTALGKPPTGRISLVFAREGDAITARLSDDGAGIDPERIRRAATSRGLITADSADALSDAAALRLIFLPGFSTSSAVSEVSGRGVGMDAVQAAVENLRGSVTVESTPGSGTQFRIHMPANALTTHLLVITVAGERYGVPLDQIAETLRADRSALIPVGTGLAIVLRGQTVPVLDLAELLDARAMPSKYARMVIARSRGETVALLVDRFAARIEAVVRPPAGILNAVPGIAGTALMGDGGVLVILDLAELAA